MSEKDGRSEEKEDFWGNKYTQHYDSDGNKTGYSEAKEDFWGNSYTQNYDEQGEKTGYSENKEDFWGNEYTQSYQEDGSEAGWSEEKETFFGDKYNQQYDEENNKDGWNERRETFFGDRYTQYYSDSDKKKNTSSDSTEGYTYTSCDSPHNIGSNDGFNIFQLLHVVAFIFLILYGISFFTKNDLSSDHTAKERIAGKAYINTLNLNVRYGSSVTYEIITSLHQGAVVDFHERIQGSNGEVWVKIHAGSVDGWVNQKYLRLIK